MHKVIKRTMKYTALAVGVLLVVLVSSVTYLYRSADMLSPDIFTIGAGDAIVENDSLRHYGPNFLRRSSSGLWELRVQGNPFQLGHAAGRLSPDLLYHQEKVFIDQIKEIVPSDRYLKFLRFFTVLFNRNLGENVTEEYREEIFGISMACTHEYDFIGTPYERQLNYHSAHDLGHAMQDYMLVGCSSFATWGQHSADSSLLIGRNFDFYVGDSFALNKQVSFYDPSGGYRFASVGWPGMIGVLSGMNETGLTVTINAAKSDMPTASATPISILTREILQYASTIDEAVAIARKRRTFVSESILIGSAKDGRAAIIEKSPEKLALFLGNGNSNDDGQLICTNHYQSETFAHDKRNQENIATSDSPYRFARLEELLEANRPIDPTKAASILRDRKGLKGADLGMANEMAINQFIAHHSVIFQPEKRLMWVSTSPWQCGKYVAYDLNKIFGDSLNFRQEIATPELTIAEDPFVRTPAYSRLLTYRKLTPLIRQQTKRKAKLKEHTLQLYESSNPSFYYTHEVLGDYYQAAGQLDKALTHWNQALTFPIGKQGERARIQKKTNILQP